MNICFVIISSGWGGAETVVYELARQLRENGHSVGIILNQEIIKYYDNLEGVEIFSIGNAFNHKILIKSIIFPNSKTNIEANSSSFPWSILNNMIQPISFSKKKNAVMLFLKKINADIVHSHLENSDILVHYLNDLKIPWVGTIHGLKPQNLQNRYSLFSFLNFKKNKVQNNALSEMSEIIFVSNWLSKFYLNNMLLANKSTVIYNGIKLSDFKRNSWKTLKLKGDFNILFSGGAKPFKGGDILIEALKKVMYEIESIHLYIALDVPENHVLRKMVADLGLEQNVTFSGFLPTNEYRTLLKSVDLFCMPSMKEAFGLVFLEAMAMGKPIIAANCGGVPEFVINGRNGFTMEPNPEEVANAILYLYNNEKLRREISRNNLQDVKKFDWAQAVKKYTTVYTEILIENKSLSK